MNGHLLWFRMWSEAVDDEKLRLLAFEDRWHFIALLCCKAQGLLDNPGDLMRRKVAVKLGLQLRELEEVSRRLSEVELIDQETLQPNAWEARQRPSDRSAERTREWRERRLNTSDVTETSQKRHCDTPEAEAEAEAEAEGGTPLPPVRTAITARNHTATPTQDDVIPAGVDPHAWSEFVAHRREIKKPLTSRSAEANAKILRAMNPTQQRESVNASVSNGWRGIFAPKTNTKQQSAGVVSCDAFRDMIAKGEV